MHNNHFLGLNQINKTTLYPLQIPAAYRGGRKTKYKNNNNNNNKSVHRCTL